MSYIKLEFPDCRLEAECEVDIGPEKAVLPEWRGLMQRTTLKRAFLF